jgi:flagellar biosynthesis protein FlhB
MKIGIISFIGYRLIASRLYLLLSEDHLSPTAFISFAWQLLTSAAMRLALVLLAFGIVDYAWQRFRLTRQMHMTKREVQDELKQTDGDPKQRSRRKQLARKRLVTSPD